MEQDEPKWKWKQIVENMEMQLDFTGDKKYLESYKLLNNAGSEGVNVLFFNS